MIKKITWLIVIRLVILSLFFSIGTFVVKVDKSFFYFLIAFIYLLSLIYLIWLLNRRFLQTLLIVQIIADVIFETAIIYYTGGVDSLFIILYLVSVLNASVIVSPIVGMITTGFVSVMYLVQVGCAYFVPSLTMYANKDQALLLYTVHVHLVTFVLIGLLASLLSRKVNQMEEKVKENERLSIMGEFSAHIAHEIRNPLTTISGSVELLKEELPASIGSDNIELMNSIVKESERVSRIFEDFLDISRAEKMNRVKINLNELIDEVLHHFRNKGSLKNISISKSYTARNLVFTGDFDQMKQVFANLIQNAIEAMDEVGSLSIKTVQNTFNVRAFITDTGDGIRKEALKDIFMPFHTTKKSGTGLGLAISNRIVKNHGGIIKLENEQSSGARVTVSLPKNLY